MSSPIPDNEVSRLEVLEELDLMYSGASPEFDAIASLTSAILRCPVALISIVGEHTQWFKANCGLDAEETARDVAFCSHAIMGDAPLIVPDARKDDRFKDNPLVLGEPNIVFYAGVPISIDNAHKLGTLCVIDTKPRHLSEFQIEQLRNLGVVAEGLIASFKAKGAAEKATRQEALKSQELAKTTDLFEQIKTLSGVGGWELVLDPPSLTWTNETKRIHEVPLDYEPQLDEAIHFYAPSARDTIRSAVDIAMSTGKGWDLELPLITARDREIWVRAIGTPTIENDVVTGAIGAFQDITERKLSEQRFRDSEQAARARSEELQNILENMDEGVSVFDENGCITVWNSRYLEIYNKPEGEVREGVSIQELFACEEARGAFQIKASDHLDTLFEQLKEHVPVSYQLRSNAGRVIKSVHSPLPNGGWVATHSDVTEEVLAAERDEYASRHDPLTGLPNRLAFNSRIEDLQDESFVKDSSVALLLVDLDYFKEVNDTHGHQAGDDLLVAASRRLKRCVREGDLVARLGGDEFAIIIDCPPGSEHDVPRNIASEISKVMKKPFKLGANMVRISASIGVTVANAKALKIDEAISKADFALYKVKESCRGEVQVFDEILASDERRHRRVHSAVKSAVLNHKLKLAFQPVFDLKTLEQAGAEVLVRWSGQNNDDLRASEIIRIAEETGAIDEIGAWVLQESIRCASEWDLGYRIAVNVSPIQLGKGRLINQVSNSLNEWNFPASLLELEITENTLLTEDDSVLQELHAIQSLGAKIVLDDFGTGYASLSYLQRFPFDKLKIDRSFVVADANEAQSKAIVNSIVTLADQLGMETTAEGVESEDRLRQITEAGCTFAQGFYLAKPIPAEEIRQSRSNNYTLKTNS